MGSTAGGAEAQKEQFVAKCEQAAESAIYSTYDSAFLGVVHVSGLFTRQHSQACRAAC